MEHVIPPPETPPRAELRAQIEDAAWSVVTLLEKLVDRRINERVRLVSGGRIEVDDNSRGTIGYEALRHHVRDALVELMRRLYAIARPPQAASQPPNGGEER